MAEVEEVPRKEDEVITKQETKGSPITSIVTKDEVPDDASKSAKSPSKCPADSPKKSTEEKKASPVKSSKQSPKKKVESEAEDNDSDEEEKEEEEKKGIYDMPLVIEGKRKRESTSFLKVEEKFNTKHKAPAVAGSGTALEDIPFVAHQIDTEKKVIDLRPLYRICYGTPGTIKSLRKELKKFNGFSFVKNSEEYKRKHAVVNKYTRADLSHMRRILGMAPGKSKDDEVQIIMDFLLKPHDEGKNVPKKGSSRKSVGKTPSKKKVASSAKKTTSKETVDTESDEEDNDSESASKKTPKKAVKKRKADDQSVTTASKKAKKADSEDESEQKDDDHSVTSSSDSSEKKEEKTELTPSDNEVKAKISELLKTFDLTSVSMKQMVLAVCEAFPEHPELNERTTSIKAFIKDAIKEDE